MPDIPNIQFIYLLFIINSSVSYFFIYKKLLLDSDQKGYIANKIIMNTNMIKSIGEVIILVCTKNYILYLSIAIIATIIQNIFISARCNKLYPYLREETKERVEKDTIKELKNNTSASVLYRLGIVALNGTDNIIISKFIGIAMVGIYSNYLLIVNAISNVISQVFSAITSSVGNMVVKESSDKSEKVFYQLQFLNFWLYTIFAICITILINPFIKMWAGEEYVLNTIVAFSVGLNLYIYGMQGVVTSYRNAYGLFVQGKYRPIIMAIVNIVVSIILAKCMGILGVIIGTIISRLFILGIYDPVVVFRYGLKKDVKKYFISYIQYLLIYIIISMMGVFLFKYIEVKNYIIWIISALCAVICINLVLVLLFFKSENFIFYKEKLVNIIRKMR